MMCQFCGKRIHKNPVTIQKDCSKVRIHEDCLKAILDKCDEKASHKQVLFSEMLGELTDERKGSEIN